MRTNILQIWYEMVKLTKMWKSKAISKDMTHESISMASSKIWLWNMDIKKGIREMSPGFQEQVNKKVAENSMDKTDD